MTATPEQLEAQKKKEEEEAASLLKEGKVTSPILKKQPTDPPTKEEFTDAQKLRIFEIQQKTVREQGARLTQTENELAALKAKQEEEVKPTMEESAKKFYADPVGVMKEALEAAVAPLNAFKDRFEGEADYVRIKKGLMSNPVYAQHLNNPQFAGIIDELIADGQRGTGIEVSERIVEAAIKHTLGSIVAGDIVIAPVKGVTTEETTEAKTEEENKLIPPYLQPSSPPQKSRTTEKQYRDLTENEARLAKEKGQTKEQYLDWLEVDPADVIDSKIGIPEKKAEVK